MSIFDNLFNKAESKSSKVDNKVAELFSEDVKEVKKRKINERTVVEVPQTYLENQKKDEDISIEEAENEETFEENEKTDVGSSKANRKGSRRQSNDDDLESKYFQKILADKEQKSQDARVDEKTAIREEVSSSKDSKQSMKSKRTEKAKTMNLKEDELEKAERTVFIGNVSNKVLSSKHVYKSFTTLFSHFGKVQSVRFRSISFEEPLPRKAAFAKKSLHESRESLNAYIVFKEKGSSLKAVERLNATVFEDLHLRVDHVAHPSPKDNKRTIFVGNLDFEEKEENLWRYFNSHTEDDVVSVRVVRDSKTNIGKGFALVQFGDSLSVNKALLLNNKPISGQKSRKLRISKAKANAKPSLMSPNHIENRKKTKTSKIAHLTEAQKTKLGRASSVLGKADRSNVRLLKPVIEGQRAKKSDSAKGIEGFRGRKNRSKVKKPRITKRSKKFKESNKP